MVSILLFSHSAPSNKLHIQKEKERMRERGERGWDGLGDCCLGIVKTFFLKCDFSPPLTVISLGKSVFSQTKEKQRRKGKAIFIQIQLLLEEGERVKEE